MNNDWDTWERKDCLGSLMGNWSFLWVVMAFGTSLTPEVSSGLPHVKSINWFLGCSSPFFSFVYAGAEFPVERAAFDFWNTTLAQCSGSEVWKPLQASPHKIMLMFSNWRKWEGKPDWCAVWEGWWCLHWSLPQQRKGGFHVTAAVTAKEEMVAEFRYNFSAETWHLLKVRSE